jgi:hypothetical protein
MPYIFVVKIFGYENVDAIFYKTSQKNFGGIKLDELEIS